MSLKPLFKITEPLIKKYCDEKTFKKGEEYIDAVGSLTCRGAELSVKVYGSANKPYRVEITFNKENWNKGYCNCPVEIPPCKHIVATLLKIAREGFDSIEPPFDQTLLNLDAKELRTLLPTLIPKKLCKSLIAVDCLSSLRLFFLFIRRILKITILNSII